MKKVKHVGLHASRLKREPEEKRFAKAWQKTNDDNNTLAWLLQPGETAIGQPVEPLPSEALVAATVMQWLGSPVGQAFLRDLGYERKRRRKGVDDD